MKTRMMIGSGDSSLMVVKSGSGLAILGVEVVKVLIDGGRRAGNGDGGARIYDSHPSELLGVRQTLHSFVLQFGRPLVGLGQDIRDFSR